MSDSRKVCISVEGGVAEVEYSPPGIEVEIWDFDNFKEEGTARKMSWRLADRIAELKEAEEKA